MQLYKKPICPFHTKPSYAIEVDWEYYLFGRDSNACEKVYQNKYTGTGQEQLEWWRFEKTDKIPEIYDRRVALLTKQE